MCTTSLRVITSDHHVLPLLPQNWKTFFKLLCMKTQYFQLHFSILKSQCLFKSVCSETYSFYCQSVLSDWCTSFGQARKLSILFRMICWDSTKTCTWKLESKARLMETLIWWMLLTDTFFMSVKKLFCTSWTHARQFFTYTINTKTFIPSKTDWVEMVFLSLWAMKFLSKLFLRLVINSKLVRYKSQSDVRQLPIVSLVLSSFLLMIQSFLRFGNSFSFFQKALIFSCENCDHYKNSTGDDIIDVQLAN